MVVAEMIGLVGVILVGRLWPLVDWGGHLALAIHPMVMYCPAGSRGMVSRSQMGAGGNEDFQHLVDLRIPEQ